MTVPSLPDELVTGIIAEAGALAMKENGWGKVHRDIKRGLNVVKHTELGGDIEYTAARRVKTFYAEDTKLLTWLKRSDMFINTNVYVHGNPFQGYDFV